MQKTPALAASTDFLENKKTTYLVGLFTVCFLSSTLGGTVSTLMSVYLPVVVKDLVGNLSQEKMNEIGAYINSIFIFGWTFGGVVWGMISDKVGRKKGFILCTIFYGVFTALTTISPTWFLVMLCRFLAGFGVGGVLVTTTILVAEAWTDRKKAIALGILSISIPVGIFSAGLINYLLPSWRQAFLTGIIPALVGITSIFILRENDNEEKESRAIDQHAQLQNHFFSSAYRKNIIAGSIVFGTMLIGLWAVFAWLPSWVQSISTDVDAQHDRGLSMMIMGMGGLTGGFISGWVVNAFGLRKTMITCFVVCFIMTFFLFKLNHVFSVAAYVELIFLALFFGISQGALSVYIPSLFPANVRASATGFCFNVGRLFTGAAVFFVGSLVIFFGGYANAIFIFSFVFVLGLIIILIKPEA